MWEAFALIGSAVLGYLINGYFSEKQNEQNIEFQKQTNEMIMNQNQKNTEEQWARDERAITTQVDDAIKAGLSPLAVVNGGGAQVSNALPVNIQSPNVDYSNLMSMFAQMPELTQREIQSLRSNRTEKKRIATEEEKIKQDAQNLEKELKTKVEIAGIEDETKRMQIQTSIDNLNKQLAKEQNIFNKDWENKYWQQTAEQAAKNAAQEINGINNSLGIQIRTRIYEIHNQEELEAYIKYQQKWSDNYVAALKKAQINPDKESIQTQSSINGGGSIGALGATISGNGGQSSGASKSKDVTRVNTKILTEALAGFAPYGIPVFIKNERK